MGGMEICTLGLQFSGHEINVCWNVNILHLYDLPFVFTYIYMSYLLNKVIYSFTIAKVLSSNQILDYANLCSMLSWR